VHGNRQKGGKKLQMKNKRKRIRKENYEIVNEKSKRNEKKAEMKEIF
jgi:hypothetical protein